MSIFELLGWISIFVISTSVGVLLMLWTWSPLRVYWKLQAIPSLSAIPVVGDMLFVAVITPEELMDKIKCWVLTRKLRRAIKAVLLGIPSVLIVHPDDVERLLGSTTNIKKGPEYLSLKSWLNEGLLLSDGKKWRQRRKLLTPTFHFRILEDNLGQMARHSQLFAKKLISTKGSPVLIDDYIRKLTLDVICETAMGIKLDTQMERNGYVRAIKTASDIIMKRVVQIWLRKDWIFNLTSTGKVFNKCVETMHHFTQWVIEDRKEERNKQKDNAEYKGKRKAFLDILLETEECNPGTFSSADIREEVDTFMFEGHDTTAAALGFALYSLSLHPDIQEAVYEEQVRIFGSEDRQPTMQDLQDMTYLEMVIKEVLRLYPSVPFISRTLSQDMIMSDGVILAAGTHVAILPYLVHRNPEFWEDPEEFRPDRFSPGSSRHPYSYIPFSAGPRNCIGMKFAMMEMKTTLSAVIRKCKVEPITREITLSPMVILTTTEPIKISISPRPKPPTTNEMV